MERFQSLGSFPRLRDELNKEAIDGAASSANVLSIQAEMASGPDAEWGLILRKSRITSSGVMSRGHIGRIDDPGIKAGCKKRVEHHGFIRVFTVKAIIIDTTFANWVARGC